MVTPNTNGAQLLAQATEAARQENADAEQKARPRGRPRADGKPPGSVPPEQEPPRSHHKPRSAGGTGSGGSKSGGKKYKAKVNLPPGILAAIALAPLGITSAVLAKGLKLPELANVPPSEATQKATIEAFQLWLDSIEVELTPGYALLLCYANGLVELGAVALVLAEQRAQAAKRDAGSAATPQPGAPAPGPAAVPTTPEVPGPAAAPDAPPAD